MTTPTIHADTQSYETGFGATFAKLIMLAIVGVTGFLSLAMFAG